jgi:hypothetical protein
MIHVTQNLAPKAQLEGSQTCNVWNIVDENISALKTRTECFFARLQRAKSDCAVNQTLHVWLPSALRLPTQGAGNYFSL